MLSLIFSVMTFVLSLSAPAPSSSPNPTAPPTASGYNCYCHDIGHKDWGK